MDLVSWRFQQLTRFKETIKMSMVAFVRSQASPFGISNVQSGNKAEFSAKYFGFPPVSRLSYHRRSILISHSSTYRRRCIILAIDSIVKWTLLPLQIGQLQFLWRDVVAYVSRSGEMAFLRLLTDIPLSLGEFTYFIVCLLGSMHKTSYCFIPVSKY